MLIHYRTGAPFPRPEKKPWAAVVGGPEEEGEGRAAGVLWREREAGGLVNKKI